jgi:D-tyrosyl-tRNA(Tyr) deacylase
VRAVVQRVARAVVRRVDVEPPEEARIERGAVVLAGFCATDEDAVLAWMADKVLGLRIFADADGALNRSVGEVGGALLVVPNFTLYGDASKGRRPSFTAAAPPGQAAERFAAFLARLRRGTVAVEAGWFQAHMHVELVNDGPVTILLER